MEEFSSVEVEFTNNGRQAAGNGRAFLHDDPPSTSLSTMQAQEGAGVDGRDPDAFDDRDQTRYRRILIFFARIILHIILYDIIGGRLPFLGDLSRRSRSRRQREFAHRFRLLAIDMGGVMIKLGQFLSARFDVLPPEITEELLGLQDEVPPVDPALIMQVLEAELGHLPHRFSEIEMEPLAAASLGQAHRAWMLPGSKQERGAAVVIKIQRPGIERVVRTDLAALKVVARWVMRYRPISRRANVPALMDEFSATLWEELDYLSEADNAERFAALYANNERVYIPAVYREHSTARVIVLENVTSIKITDAAGMAAAGIDPKEVAAILLDTYFHQIFYERFFHADPHPGNLFVHPRPDIPWTPVGNGAEPAAEGRPFWIVFIDFGMVGRVPDLVGDNLKQVLMSVVQRDGRALTEAYANLGFFLPSADLERISEAQEVVLDRIWGRNLLDLAQPDPRELQELGQEFHDLLFDFPFQIPQDFIYLGRALGIVSGMVSQLDQTINPWYFIEKYGEELISSQEAQSLTWEAAWAMIKPYLTAPARVQRLLEMAEKGQLRVQSDKEVIRRYERIEKRVGQLGWSIMGAAGMLSAMLLYLNRKNNPQSRKGK